MQRLKQIQHYKKQKIEHILNLKMRLSVVLFCTLSVSAFADRIIYVDDDANGANNGSSWENAYVYLQDALATAQSPEIEKPLEIRVGQGIYKPNLGRFPIWYPGMGDYSPGVMPGDEGRLAAFGLINGVTIKGGYAGVNEQDPNARDVKLYESVLSGDLNGNDIEIIDPCDLLDDENHLNSSMHDNSVTVVTCSYNDANAVIDGFTITSGHEWGWSDPGPSGGGGMIIGNGNPSIIECTFTCNSTRQYGGGILILSSSPTLINCTFTRNYADSGAGIYNGRIFGGPFGPPERRETGNPTLINCTFTNNYARWIGGGIYNYGGNSSLLNCTFSRNFGSGFIGGGNSEFVDCIFVQNTGREGGGVSCGGSPTFTNCIFSNNSTKNYGGGMNCSNGLLTDCIFSGNSAGRGGGGLAGSDLVLNNCIFTGNKVYGEKLYQDEGGGCRLSGDNTTLTNCSFYCNWARQGRAIFKSSNSVLRINNCILWDGGDEISRSHPSTLTVTYSDVRGGMEGEGNIDADPCFADPGYWADADDPNLVAEPNDPNAVWVDGDYHLKTQAGRWDPDSQSWVQDDVTSPCIDAGDPNSPIGHEPFPNGGIINMGAYGGTVEASKSYFGKPVCETIIAGDINGDCKVDFDDLMILMNHWLEDHTPQD